jgi:hypothetical protein
MENVMYSKNCDIPKEWFQNINIVQELVENV